MNRKQENKKRAREIAMEHSKALLRAELRMFRKFCYGALYDDNLTLKIFSERISKRSFRVHFIQCVYAYILDIAEEEGCILFGGLNEEQILVKIPFLAEGIISVLYHQNFIFDRKRGVTTLDKIRINVLAGNLLERAIYAYCESELHNSDEILKALRDILILTDIGQHIEGQFNTFEQYCNKNLRTPKDFGNPIKTHLKKDCFQQVFILLKKNVPPEKHEYLRLYLLRISLTSAAMFVKITELLCDLTGYIGMHKKKIIEYAYIVGILLQIVNDCIDFVPSVFNPDNVASKSNNCCCDIKNKNITLPLIHFLSNSEKNGNGIIINLLNSDFNFMSKEEELKVFHEIAPIIVQMTLKDCESIAKLACQQLSKKEISDELIGKTEIAFDNLFTKVISKHQR